MTQFTNHSQALRGNYTSAVSLARQGVRILAQARANEVAEPESERVDSVISLDALEYILGQWELQIDEVSQYREQRLRMSTYTLVSL